VPWVGIDSNQAGDIAVDPGFLFDLAPGCLADGFTWLHSTAGDRPVLVVGPADQEDASLVVKDNDADRWHDAVSFRRGRVV
jgi:hypothetical protein